MTADRLPSDPAKDGLIRRRIARLKREIDRLAKAGAGFEVSQGALVETVANSYWALGDPASRDWYRRAALHLDQGNAAPSLRMALLWAKAGDPTRMRQECRRIAEGSLQPPADEKRLQQAIARLLLGDYSSVESLAESSVDSTDADHLVTIVARLAAAAAAGSMEAFGTARQALAARLTEWPTAKSDVPTDLYRLASAWRGRGTIGDAFGAAQQGVEADEA